MVLNKSGVVGVEGRGGGGTVTVDITVDQCDSTVRRWFTHTQNAGGQETNLLPLFVAERSAIEAQDTHAALGG
jgi:hypothetical protein